MKVHHAIEAAAKVLDGEVLSEAEALDLALGVHGCDILDLVSLANKVRDRFAPEIIACSIVNAKSGKCSQNCRFCSQSAHHSTEIETYPLLPVEEILAGARAAFASGVRAYGIVTSGIGYTEVEDPEFRRILDIMDRLHAELPELKLCISIGILSEATAQKLAEHHAWRYNMNLQTAPERYRELISSTHTIEEKIRTIRYLQQYGVTICCGGIIGLGEDWRDRVSLALAVRELGVEGVPLNVLLPIPGTPLEKLPVMAPADVAKCFAIFRLINPDKTIKFTAGRETAMKDFQGLLMLAGPNSLMTGGYLTTRGRSVTEDQTMIRQLGDFTDHAGKEQG